MKRGIKFAVWEIMKKTIKPIVNDFIKTDGFTSNPYIFSYFDKRHGD